MKPDLYFIAIIPSGIIQSEITRFKEEAFLQFDSSRALRSPPHITLFPPFRWPAVSITSLLRCLREFITGESSFELSLSGFNCFPPRVIFVDVIPSAALTALQQHLKMRLEEELQLTFQANHGFNPHITVAFKDLKRSIFPKAWAYFKEIPYERQFRVDRIVLLRHNGERWIIFETFKMPVREG